MAMTARKPRKPRPQLNATKVEELAIFYVGRFATSRAKLLSYLRRKVRERGWAGEGEPDFNALADKMVRLGYVDDRSFALSKARSLTSRGYGERRVGQALMQAGIGEDEASDARVLAQSEAVDAALRFARRRSIGPYALSSPDPKERERALAAMMRAGHRFALARAIVDMEPGSDADVVALAESC